MGGATVPQQMSFWQTSFLPPRQPLLIVASPVSALAGELPKEGNYDFISCSSSVYNAIRNLEGLTALLGGSATSSAACTAESTHALFRSGLSGQQAKRTVSPTSRLRARRRIELAVLITPARQRGAVLGRG